MKTKLTCREFLQAIFGSYFKEHGGYVEIREINSEVKQHYFKEIDRIAEMEWKGNTFFGVCPREEKVGRKESVSYITALWVDIDRLPEEALKQVDSFEFQPSCVVSSGSGLHAYWFLREPEGVSGKAEGILKGLSKALKGDTTYDLARVMRLPGTFNRKDPNNPKEVEILSLKPELRYSLSDFEQYETEVFSCDMTTCTYEVKDVDIDALPVSEEWKICIVEGKHPTKTYPSRSERDQAVMNALVSYGVTDDVAYSIFHNKRCAVSEKVFESGDAYFNLTFSKAKDYCKPREIFATRTPEAEELKSSLSKVISLREAKIVFRKWLYLDDDNVLDIVFGVIVANKWDCDPVWLFLVAPPSSGKTEILRTFKKSDGANLPGFYSFSKITDHTLISGLQLGNNRGDYSLLPKLDGKVVLIKDFTSVLNMRREARENVFNDLRECHDGYLEKEFGSTAQS